MHTAPVRPQAEEAAAHLRHLVECQPGCLLRADLEGRLLAVNGAALRLFAAPGLEAALTRTMYDFIAEDDHARWREFAGRAANSPASVECDLTDLAGTRRTLLFQGVPLTVHPDGIPSLLLTAHDMTSVRRLEEALAARTREIDTHVRVVAALRNETTKLRALLDERQHTLQATLRALDVPMRRAVDELRTAAGAVAALSRQIEQAPGDHAGSPPVEHTILRAS